MKDIFDIFDTSKVKDTNRINSTNNSDSNNQQHKLNKKNINKNKPNQQRNTTNSILQYFLATNAKVTISNHSSSKPSVIFNRPDSFLTIKTQHIIQRPSNIRPPTNTFTLIKTIVAATKKLKEIRNKVFKRNKQQTNKTHYSINSSSTPNYILWQRPSTTIPQTKVQYNINHL